MTGKTGAPRRDRCKSRHFDKIFETFSDAFKEDFRKQPMSEQTRIINEGFTKEGHRLVPRIMEQYRMREQIRREQGRKNIWQGKALLEEAAAKKLGGADKFQGSM